MSSTRPGWSGAALAKEKKMNDVKAYEPVIGGYQPETMAERLGEWKTGDRAIVLSVCMDDYRWVVGREVVVDVVDRADSSRTFRVMAHPVEGGDPEPIWVHRLAPVEPVEASPLDGLSALVAQQAADLEALRSRLQEAHARENGFKDTVREVAIRVAEEQNWCDTGLNAVLEELGLDPKTAPVKRITMTVSITFLGEPSQSDPAEDWISSSITNVDLTMDNDWADVEVDEWSVTSVDEIEDAE